MNRNLIASELLKAAEEMIASEYWTDMPDRVGKWVKNKSRARRDEKILEYVELGGRTVLVEADGDYVKWEMLEEDGELIDAGRLNRNPRSMTTTLKGLARMYNASSKRTAGVADTIAKQMGGAGRLKMMLGAKVMKVDGKTLGIKWPNKNRSKGNYVEISLRGDDTYDMEFFNVSTTARKTVKKFRGVYNDQLVELFEKQTGWYLRI